jgi:hypothetical protein
MSPSFLRCYDVRETDGHLFQRCEMITCMSTLSPRDQKGCTSHFGGEGLDIRPETTPPAVYTTPCVRDDSGGRA